MTDEEERQAIIREIAEMLPTRLVMQPWMFTARDVAEQSGRRFARVLNDLQELVAQGKLQTEPDGYNPATGRRVTLFWRPEDVPKDG